MTSVLILLLLAVACTGGTGAEQRLTQAFDEAQIIMRRGELARAQALIDQALKGAAESDSAAAWRLRLLRAETALDRLGPSDSALLTATLPPDPSFDVHRARQKYLQARVQVNEGKLPEATRTLDSARPFARDAADAQDDADILAGQIQLRQGEWEAAGRNLDALIQRTGARGDRYRQAIALNTRGMGYLIRGRYDEAASWFERVLAVPEVKDLSIHAVALSNVGICYARVGQFERAMAAQREAVRIYERGGPSRQLVESLGSLGNTHVLNGDSRTAISFLTRAMDAAIAAKLSSDSAFWAGNLADAHASLGHWDEAERFNNEARTLSAGHWAVRPVHFTLNAAEIAAGRGQHQEARRLFEDALAASEDIPSVVWSAHAGLAETAIAMQQPQEAARHFEAALATIEKTRSNLLKTEFRLSFLTPLIDFYRNYVDALLAQGRVERALEIAESSRARVLAERHGIQAAAGADAAALRRVARQSGSVLLAYWLAPDRSSMWIVTPDRIQHVPLPPSAEIEELVRQHQAMIHNTLANPLAQGGTPGARLFQALIAPASPALTPNAPVVIVPDGALHRLNFETLVASGGSGSHYWIEDAEVQIAPSLMLLATRQPQRPAHQSVLLIGDATAREPEFPALKYAPAEMASITRHFPAGSVTVHRGEDAVPAVYRDAPLDRFGIIHFTAHAVASTESPLDSAIMLSGPDQGFKLYARDVAERPLAADLVTVSACRSAGERTYSGEGLVGFAWAFLRAGGRRVIAGLWDVDDRSTAELMDDVYGKIAAGVAPQRALREAKLALLHRGGTTAKPYYWAPFEVFTLTASN